MDFQIEEKFKSDNSETLISNLDLNVFQVSDECESLNPEKFKESNSVNKNSTKVKSIPDAFKKVYDVLTSKPNDVKLTAAEQHEIIKNVTVGPLPQRFLAKFVGSKPCDGLWGSKYTRGPVDSMVRELRQMDKKDDLPLVNFKIQEDGIKIVLHPKSRTSVKFAENNFLPLHFISYAVQDSRYSKLFVFIIVREMSSKKRVTECQAYLSDGIVSCRKMALSMADAFKKLEQTMKDKPIKFQVDLKVSEDDTTEI